MRIQFTGIAWAIVTVAVLSIGLVAPVVEAANPDKDALVKIKIRPKPGGGGDELLVGPRGVGFCRGGAKDDCWANMKFRWIGNSHGYDRITITFLNAVSPTNGLLNKPCVTPAVISLGKPGDEVSASATADADCSGKIAVFYEVVAKAAGGAKPDLTKDPGVIIDN